MEEIHSMSQTFYNQVDRITDVMTCKINSVETRCYKVQWKCTWEPEVILDKFCCNIIEDYKRSTRKKNLHIKVTALAEKQTHKFDTSIEKNDLTNIGLKQINDIEVSNTENDLKDKQAPSYLNNRSKDIGVALDKLHGEVNKSTTPLTSNVGIHVSSIDIVIKPDPDEEVFPQIDINTPDQNNKFSKENKVLQSREDVMNNYNEKLLSNQSSLTKKKLNSDQNVTNCFPPAEYISLQLNKQPTNLFEGGLFGNAIPIRPQMPSIVGTSKYRVIAPKSVENKLQIVQAKPNEVNQFSTTSLLESNDTDSRNVVNKRFRCELCSYSSPLSSNVRRHMRRHTGQKPYKCNQCSYSAVQKHHLTLHSFKHSGEKPLKCSECSFTTSMNSSLKVHMVRHKPS